MIRLETIREFCTHGDWANDRLVSAAEGLSDEQLDRPIEMGRGDLRKTLLHIYAGEYVWLQRWIGNADQPWVAEGEPLPVAEIARLFKGMRADRDASLASLTDRDLNRTLGYLDTLEGRFTAPLGDMLLQGCSHSMHHRAQAANMLRRVGVKPPGLDYLLLRLLTPTIELDADVKNGIRSLGIVSSDSIASPGALDPESMLYFYRYGDWAFGQLLDAADRLDDEQLDRRFDIGPGTLRLALLHIHDAEHWWCGCWTADVPLPEEDAPESTPLAELRAQFDETRRVRNAFLEENNEAALQRVTSATLPSGTKVTFRIGETILQLCGHGTHHRAQAVNMLRRLGAKPPELDYMMWVRKPA